jgi:FkbM family methyltransferase
MGFGRGKSIVSVLQKLKRTSSVCIRAGSYLIPTPVLFPCLVAGRRVDNYFRKRGSPRLLRKAVDHFYCSLRPELVETSLYGMRFRIRLNDPFHYDLLLEHHEAEIVQWLSENIKPGMVVFDVGANIGSYALTLARLVGPAGRVFTIEADPDIAAVLSENIRANRLFQVTVIQGAAYREARMMRLGRAAASSSYSGLYYENPEEWIEVPAFTLDEVAAREGLKRLDLVKIDAEGAEDDVVAGMSQLLCTLRPAILVELHSWHGSDTNQLPAKLESMGYSIDMLTVGHALARPRRP